MSDTVWPKKIEDIREVWPEEAKHFTPWLSKPENMAQLGRAIGIADLEPLDTEYPAAMGRSLDILASAFGGARVAIENQFGKADHDHLTRGQAYAVDVEAVALVIVAEHHGPEFIAVAEDHNRMLRAADGDGYAIYMVEVEVSRVGEYVVPQFIQVVGFDGIYSMVYGKRLEAEYGEATRRLAARWEAQPHLSIGDSEHHVNLRVDGQPAAQVWPPGQASSVPSRIPVKPAQLAKVSSRDESEIVEMLQDRFVDKYVERQQDGWWKLEGVGAEAFAQFLEDVGVLGRER